jgi:hypothetical protein
MKTEVYSWRISPELKTDLEAEARRENLSVSALLERLSREWLEARRSQSGTDEAIQARLHGAAEKLYGAIGGGGAARSESVHALVRERLKRRHERSRSH